jgi:hypothetical protein
MNIYILFIYIIVGAPSTSSQQIQGYPKLENDSEVVITINQYDYVTNDGQTRNSQTHQVVIKMFNLNRVRADDILDLQPLEVQENFDLIGLKFIVQPESGDTPPISQT